MSEALTQALAQLADAYDRAALGYAGAALCRHITAARDLVRAALAGAPPPQGALTQALAALDEALRLASVPERNQDAEWQAAYDRLVSQERNLRAALAEAAPPASDPGLRDTSLRRVR